MESRFLQDSEFQVPENWKKVINRLAQNVDMGMTCGINLDTGEIICYQKEFEDYFIEEDEEYQYFVEDKNKVEAWARKCVIEPISSREGYKIMEEFVEQKIKDEKDRERLFNILSRRRPFANFRNYIDRSPYREKWFEFKLHQLEQYVIQSIIECDKSVFEREPVVLSD